MVICGLAPYRANLIYILERKTLLSGVPGRSWKTDGRTRVIRLTTGANSPAEWNHETIERLIVIE